MEFLILCDDIFPFAADQDKEGIAQLLLKVPHAIVNLENIIGDLAEKDKLRKGIGTYCHDRNEDSQIANNYAGEDSQFQPVHVIFRIEREVILIVSKLPKKKSPAGPF
jgi:hypothetical protein